MMDMVILHDNKEDNPAIIIITRLGDGLLLDYYTILVREFHLQDLKSCNHHY